jgi:hypothetical protein
MEDMLQEVMADTLDGEDRGLYLRTMWNMTNHTPPKDDIDIIETLRTDFKVTASGVVKFCPPGRERSLALTKLEEALIWAVAGIARKGGPDGNS